MMDLRPYIARGFPGNFDKGIAEVGVRGIDREQAHSMIRLCPETESVLYGREFSPTKVHYQKGSRPVLEHVAVGLTGVTPKQRAIRAMEWVMENVRHPHLIGPTPPDRALSEEDLIASGRGWCNEQARVFVALCEVMEIPARLCFVFHLNTVCGHTATEVYLQGRWAFFDQTFGVTVPGPDGLLAEGRRLSGPWRDLAHRAYAPALETYFAQVQPFVENEAGWNSRQRPRADRGGDLLQTLGICNYVIKGVTAQPRS